MSDTFTRKFTVLSDPPVMTTPFTIGLDEDKCIGCGLCIQQCPCQSLEMVDRPYSPQQEAACQFNCPAGIDVRKYMNVLAGGGSLKDAWEIITDANPFPKITGLVCPHSCEGGCNRQYLDGALNIKGVERAIGAWAVNEGLAFPAPPPPNGKKVAVVGSGPSGMSCAYHLSRKGYQVMVFESDPKPGGMLRYAIPDYRLSQDTIDKEYKRVTDMGVTLKLGCAVGKDISLDDLKSKYDAVYLAIGASKGKEPDIEAIGHVYSGLDFLRKFNNGDKVFVGQSTLVIGGGNTAIDAARTARRLGAKVTILYRRSRKEMPAFDEDIQDAIDEGVSIEYLSAPVKMASSENGQSSITCTRMILGKEDESGRCRPEPVEGSQYQIMADSVIYAIGQEADLGSFAGLACDG